MKHSGKHRSFAQRVGIGGENAFRGMAERQHLTIAIKSEEDYGVDFMCQAETSADQSSANEILPAHLAVCVRATTNATGAVTLTQSDASNILRYQDTLVFVLVHDLGDSNRKCYYRFVDPDFGQELADFLTGGNSTMTVTPNRCKTEATFRLDLATAMTPLWRQQTTLALAERRLAVLLPGATVDLRVSSGGAVGVVTALDFFDYFDQLDSSQQRAVYQAAFGVPALVDSRLGALAIREGVFESLERLPAHLELTGFVTRELRVVEVSGSYGSARCEFLYARIGSHFGWIHPAGLSITISMSKRHGDQLVHETEVFLDPDVSVTLAELSDELVAFVRRCSPDATLRDLSTGFEISVEYFAGLSRVGEAVMAEADARHLPGWSPEIAELRDLEDDETRTTIRALGTLAVEPDRITKMVGFVFDKPDEPVDTAVVDRATVPAELPLIMNSVRRGIVARVRGDAVEARRGEAFLGLLDFAVMEVELEVGERLPKQTVHPEAVLGPGWPTLVLGKASSRTAQLDSQAGQLSYRTLPPD